MVECSYLRWSISLLLLILQYSSLHCRSHTNNASDLSALLAFRASITSDPFSSLYTWNPNTTFCNWRGVNCSSKKERVIALNLTGFGLEGFVTPRLANISLLGYLDISNNSFHGPIPEELGHLVRLKQLVMYRNNLQGSVPTSLSDCRRLAYLDLSNNNLRGTVPNQLGLLQELQHLRLGHNNLTGTIPPFLQNLSALIELNLQNNNFHGAFSAALCNCTNLRQLVLHRNQLTGHIPSETGAKLTKLELLSVAHNRLVGNIPISISNCTKLTYLELNVNQLNGTVPVELGKLVFLEVLKIQNNFLVSGSNSSLPFLTHLTNCSSLLRLIFANNLFRGVLPPAIGQLSPKLFTLSLHDNFIGGSIPHQIGNLTNLNYLGFHFNFFNGRMPSELGSLQKLERMRLYSNKLQGSIPHEISHMKGLGELSLQRNMISGSIPDALANLQQLRILDISGNQLSGKIPDSIGNVWRLEHLDLSCNQLSGAITPEIANLSNLQTVFNLSCNFLEGSVPAGVGKMTMVQSIDMSFNHLSGGIPAALGSCAGLQNLNLSHNELQGPIPQSFYTLQNLEDMDISSNNISGEIPASLGKLKLLRKLNFSFNNLVGEVPVDGVFANNSAVSFIGNPGLCGTWPSLPPCNASHSSKHTSLLLFRIVVVPAASIIALILGFLVLRFVNSRRACGLKVLLPKHGYPRFTYQQLVNATDDFSETNLLGAGSYGSVYRGTLSDGTAIAVKVLRLQEEAIDKSFVREIRVLSRVRHRNLNKMIGFCSEPHFQALVFLFMSNGSLGSHLYPEGVESIKEEDACKLSLKQRLDIAIDVAHAVSYLHHGYFAQVVHCDIKPSNVLLDEDMTAHVTDFGIARLASAGSEDSSLSTLGLQGSIGYIAPEYGFGVRVSTKGDVYSFGIVLLETLTRKTPTDNMFVDGLTLQRWVSLAFPDRLVQVLDNSLLRDDGIEQDQGLINGLTRLTHLGLLCTRDSAEERPNMTQIAGALESIRETLFMPGRESRFGADITSLLGDRSPSLDSYESF